MKNAAFPVNFKFKITSLSNDFTATDANGNVMAYVKQRLFKMKEAINIFSDETKSSLLYKIGADRWIDFNAVYTITGSDEQSLGSIGRKGAASLWRANYEIFDVHKQMKYRIKENSGWVKVWDGIFKQIPIISMFTGYFFNPTYDILDVNDRVVASLKKEASFFGREFNINKESNSMDQDTELVLLGLMMMILLERRRG